MNDLSEHPSTYKGNSKHSLGYAYVSYLDGRTVLEITLKKYVPTRGIGLIRLRIRIIGEPM